MERRTRPVVPMVGVILLNLSAGFGFEEMTRSETLLFPNDPYVSV